MVIVSLSSIKSWSQYVSDNNLTIPNNPKYTVDDEINSKISLWKGNIVHLKVDAIVNSANESLLGGQGIDGAIHAAAGPGLKETCKKIGRCKAGSAVITKGHNLPARFVIHAVGPRDAKHAVLKSTYNTCLKLMIERNIKTIAFPCISTGIFNFPKEDAVHIAASTVREFLNTYKSQVDRIIFCMYQDDENRIYERELTKYFPTSSGYSATSQVRSSRRHYVSENPMRLPKITPTSSRRQRVRPDVITPLSKRIPSNSANTVRQSRRSYLTSSSSEYSSTTIDEITPSKFGGSSKWSTFYPKKISSQSSWRRFEFSPTSVGRSTPKSLRNATSFEESYTRFPYYFSKFSGRSLRRLRDYSPKISGRLSYYDSIRSPRKYASPPNLSRLKIRSSISATFGGSSPRCPYCLSMTSVSRVYSPRTSKKMTKYPKDFSARYGKRLADLYQAKSKFRKSPMGLPESKTFKNTDIPVFSKLSKTF